MFQTTRNDVVFSGHGSNLPRDAKLTRVPPEVEFITFGPPGSVMTENLGQLQKGGQAITKIFIISPVTNEKTYIQATSYKFESGDIPNLALWPPRDLEIAGKGAVPHIIVVEAETHLADLWPRLRPFRKRGQTLRVIWSACAALDQNSNQLVDGE